MPIEHFLRAQYFVSYGVMGAVLPFQPAVFHSLGFSEAEVGALLSASGWAALIGPFLLAHFADRGIPAALVNTGALVVTACALVSMLYFRTVAGLFFASFVAHAALLPVLSLLDALTLETLSHRGTPGTFGAVRVAGSYGFILPAVLVIVLQRLGLGALEASILSGSGMAFLAAALALRSPVGQAALPRRSAFPAIAAVKLLRHNSLALFLGGQFIFSIALAFLYFAVPRAAQALGIPDAGVGLIFAIGVLAEIVCMRAAVNFRPKRELVWFLVGGASNCLRMSVLACVPNLLLLLGSQLLHGPTILMTSVLAPAFLQDFASAEARYSLYALSATATLGVARIIGPILGGQIAGFAPDESSGIELMSAVGAILTVFGTYLIGIGVVRRRRSSP